MICTLYAFMVRIFFNRAASTRTELEMKIIFKRKVLLRAWRQVWNEPQSNTIYINIFIFFTWGILYSSMLYTLGIFKENFQLVCFLYIYSTKRSLSLDTKVSYIVDKTYFQKEYFWWILGITRKLQFLIKWKFSSIFQLWKNLQWFSLILWKLGSKSL